MYFSLGASEVRFLPHNRVNGSVKGISFYRRLYSNETSTIRFIYVACGRSLTDHFVNSIKMHVGYTQKFTFLQLSTIGKLKREAYSTEYITVYLPEGKALIQYDTCCIINIPLI
jgi:hypothetical protein